MSFTSSISPGECPVHTAGPHQLGSVQYTLHYISSGQYSLYHGLAIYTEVTFVNVTLVEAGPSGGRPAVV